MQSAPDVEAAEAAYIRPGQFFIEVACVGREDRTYFVLPAAAGYMPLHSSRDISKIVVDMN